MAKIPELANSRVRVEFVYAEKCLTKTLSNIPYNSEINMEMNPTNLVGFISFSFVRKR